MQISRTYDAPLRDTPPVRPGAVHRAVEAVFDLSRPSRGVLTASFGLSREELEQFLLITANLLRGGVVGNEVLEVRGQRRETSADARMADPMLRGAPSYRERGIARNRLDLRG